MSEGNGSNTHGISRLFAVDALRGLIMVFMALDHANLLVAQKHSPGEYWGGAYPVYYDALAFVTRFLTHLSAPGFFLLMGAGMALFAHSRRARGWSRWAVIRHFLIRGAVLIALQLLVVNQMWWLSPAGWGIQIYIGVLFSLGSAMIVGSLLLWLKPIYLLGLAAALLIGTELLVPDPSRWGPGMSAFNLVLATPGGIVSEGGPLILWTNYPILPWLELAAFGLAFGHWLAQDPKAAFKRGMIIGAACIAAFIGVRYLDGFGNIRPRLGNTWIDWLNAVKYPPSIAFTTLTTGINLLVLGGMAQIRGWGQRLLGPLVVYGREPLFFYLAHILLYAGMGHLLTPNGTSIPLMYPFWLLGLLILFPLCLWYGGFKRRQPLRSAWRFA
jgi:uncharacterized membrane protein